MPNPLPQDPPDRQSRQDSQDPAATRARQRLPADVRNRQILDAALAVFSERGFEAARMDDIAARAGLSKGGLYAHFRSKDEIFEALLRRALSPSDLDLAALRAASPDMRHFAEAFVNRLYDDLMRPDALAVQRLLVADGARIPHLTAQWQHDTVEALVAQLKRVLARCVAEGNCRAGVATRHPWLLLAPVAYQVLWQLVFGKADDAALQSRRREHIALVRELLA
jgi:AcrR family transcriptional regulator